MNGELTKTERAKFDWRTIAVTFVLILVQAAINYGVNTTILANHGERLKEHDVRLDKVERYQQDNFIPRLEYDKRHADLQQEIRDLKQEVRELGRRPR